MPNNRRYALIVETQSLGDDADGIRQLRALLKRLGRGYRVHCISAKPVEPPQQPSTTPQLAPIQQIT
jgi:hypothetical protein